MLRSELISAGSAFRLFGDLRKWDRATTVLMLRSWVSTKFGLWSGIGSALELFLLSVQVRLEGSLDMIGEHVGRVGLAIQYTSILK